MSVIDQIMELEAQKQKLMDDAKRELLATAEKAVADLNNLGFQYSLVEGTVTAKGAPRTRRSSVSTDVLEVVKAAPNGLPRAAVLEQMNAHDKKSQTSVSNALANLKKKGEITLSDDGIYKAA